MKKRLLILLGVLLVLAVVLAIAVRIALGGDRIKAAIEAQATSALGRPVTIATAEPRFFPRVSLDLTGISIGSAKEVQIERARLSTGLRALFGLRVEQADIAVERSRIDVRWALALLSALADDAPGATPSSASSYALTIDSVDSIAFNDVTLLAGARALKVDMAASYTGGDRFVVQRMRAESDTSSFTATGEFTSVGKRIGKFAVDAETLDLDGLLAFLAAATPAGAERALADRAAAPPPAARVPLDIEIGIKARRSLALGIGLNDLTATARARDSDVVLEDLRVDVFGGQYTGSAAFRGAHNVGRYEWKGRFEKLDVNRLMEFAGAAGSMTGRLGGTIALAAAGADPAQAIGDARGNAAVTITDGRIPGLEIVRSVILAFGKPTGERPGGSGEAFNRIAATLAIDGPEISTSNLVFESRDFDMTGAGNLSLATKAIAFRTDIVLSKELSAQAGRDLYRLAREGERIVLPATIRGTTASPSVFIDVQAALGRALRNKAQDEFKGLLDRFLKKK